MTPIQSLLTKGKRLFRACLPKQFDYTKFVILAHARTGSNYLRNGLLQLDCVRLEEEIFASHNRKIGENYEKIIGDIFRPVEKGISHVGFKLFYYHLTPEELKKLLSISELKVIHLIRRNKLRTIISLDKARQSDQWVATKKGGSEPVTIACHDLVDRINKIEAYEKNFSAHFVSHDLLELSYEQLTEQPETAFKNVSDFLHLPSIDFQKITLKKQGNRSIKQDVTNADEVERALRGTPYGVYLSF